MSAIACAGDDPNLTAAAVAVAAAILSGVLGLLGVITGSAIALYGQARERKERRRERFRAAYSRWYRCIDWLTESDQWHVLLRTQLEALRDHPEVLKHMRIDQDLKDAAKQQSRAQHLEVAAFSALMFLDYGSEELNLAGRIRQIKPFQKAQSESVTEPPSLDRFQEFEKEQATQLSLLARNVKRRLDA